MTKFLYCFKSKNIHNKKKIQLCVNLRIFFINRKTLCNTKCTKKYKKKSGGNFFMEYRSNGK